MSIQQQEASPKRFAIAIGAVVVIAAVVLGALLFFTAEDEGVAPESRVELTSEEQREVQQVTEDFISSVGTFGYDMEKIDGDSIYQIMRLNRDGNYEALSMYANFRADTYLNARDEYIIHGSPAYYPTSQIYEWSVSLETENVFRYDVSNIVAVAPENAQLTFLQDADRKTVTVPVSFTGKQVKINEGVNDSSWDGNHQVFERVIPDITAKIVLVQIDNMWQVYNIRDVSHPYVLATWKDAKPENMRFEVNDGFENTSQLEPSEPFDIEEWAQGNFPSSGE